MSHDDIITIHADILQLTDAAVLVECEGDEVWLPPAQTPDTPEATCLEGSI